jgi:TolB protein
MHEDFSIAVMDLEEAITALEGRPPSVWMISVGAQGIGPGWSLDGTKLAFYSSREGNSEIYALNADGSGEVRLTNHPAGDGQPAWSPDGERIAFVSNRDGNWESNPYDSSSTDATLVNSEIYVMNSDGSNPIRLTNDPALDGFPSWSSDGQKITFASNRDGNWEIYVINADGTGLLRLTNNTVDDWKPVWAPKQNS